MVLTLEIVQYLVDFYSLFMTTATPGTWEWSLKCICVASSSCHCTACTFRQMPSAFNLSLALTCDYKNHYRNMPFSKGRFFKISNKQLHEFRTFVKNSKVKWLLHDFREESIKLQRLNAQAWWQTPVMWQTVANTLNQEDLELRDSLS